MKTLNWSGFFAVPRRGTPHDPGRLARLVKWMTRGATPVDGFAATSKEREPERNPEPVRWGNFR
jgi:hypothetical protein